MYLWLVLLCSLVLLPMTRYTLKIGNSKVKCPNGKMIYMFFFSLILILLTAFRSDTVGKDTAMYHQLYDITRACTNFSEVIGCWQNKLIETGYLALEFILSRVMDFHFASIVFAIISIVPVMILIYKYSENYWFSIFIYLAFGMYTFTFAGVRQSLAMGICCIAYFFAKERKPIKYIASIIIAVCIHKSAIIFLPVYWIIRIRHTKKNIIIFFIAIFISFGLQSVLYKVINLFSRYTYESTDTAGGSKLYLFIVGTLILSYFLSKRFFSGDNSQGILNENVAIFNMVAFCGLLWPITSANAVVFRLYYYYFLFFALFIPNFIKNIKKKEIKLITIGLYLFVGCYFLKFYILGNTQMMYSAYSFFWK